MSPTKKPSSPALLETEHDQPRVAQAVAIGFAVLKIGKATAWTELGGVLPAGVDLGDDQIALLHEHESTLRVLRYGVLKSGVKTTHVVVCPVCQRWMLMGASVPSTCKMSVGCPGSPFKVAIARTLGPDEERVPLQHTATLMLDKPPGDEQSTAQDPRLIAPPVPSEAFGPDPLVQASKHGSRKRSQEPVIDADEYDDVPADYDPGDDFTFFADPEPRAVGSAPPPGRGDLGDEPVPTSTNGGAAFDDFN